MLTPPAVSQVRRAVRASLALESGDRSVGRGWTWRRQVPEQDFIDAVDRHRVSLLLADHADALDLSVAVRGAILAQRDSQRLAAMSQIRLTADVATLLAGIDHLIFKGVALAALTTGDPAARGEGDVDVIVSPDRVGDAARALVAEGWTVRRTYTAHQGSWAWRYQLWGAHEMALDHNTQCVDLHWRLDPTHDGLPGFAELWARREAIKVGPIEVETLSAGDTFLHSLHHAAKDGWESLRSLVDVHRLARDAAHDVALAPVSLATLSAVDASIGLPTTALDFTRTRAPLPRLLKSQAAPVRGASFPGQRTLRQASYRWRASRTPRDLAANAATLLLPPASAVEVTAAGTATGMTRAVFHRAREVGWKLSGWRTEL